MAQSRRLKGRHFGLHILISASGQGLRPLRERSVSCVLVLCLMDAGVVRLQVSGF